VKMKKALERMTSNSMWEGAGKEDKMSHVHITWSLSLSLCLFPSFFVLFLLSFVPAFVVPSLACPGGRAI